MIPQGALPDLLAAERGLARFDMRLADPARARRYAGDAARRSVLALTSLDGELVAAEDLMLALVSPDEVDLPRRTGAGGAAALYRLLLDLHDGLKPPVFAPADLPQDGRLRPETVAAWSSLAAETRRLLAEAEAALQDEEDAGHEPAESGAGLAKPLLPWTLPWVEEIHARWFEAHHGRRPAPWTASEQEIACDALRRIDEALGADPGVAGGARALHRLHGAAELPATPLPAFADEDERSRSIRLYIARQPESGWWPQFARIVAPTLIARACRLDKVWLPVSACWGRDYTGYRTGLAGSEEAWITWMARLLADAIGGESERCEAIEARHAGWIAATAVVPRLPKRRSDTQGPTRRHRAGTRRSTSRLPQFLDLLWEQPMVSTRAVERRLGMTYRSALDLIQDLEKAGVLQRANERKLDRLWRANIR
jgi:hypothetical protein